jgi:hypothetical protein
VARLPTYSGASDDTTNIHPDQGPNNCDGPQGWMRVPVGCVFVDIIIELETCDIYKAVLLTIKEAAHNASEASNS